jgi:hypothetical protein
MRNRSKKIDKGQKEKKAMGVPRNGRKNPPWGQGNERNSSIKFYFLISLVQFRCGVDAVRMFRCRVLGVSLLNIWITTFPAP